MNKSRILLGTFLVVALLSFQFIPKSSDQLLKTNLRITIHDDLGNTQAGTIVTLYGNNEDYRASENPVAGPKTTDEKGRVTFKGLEEKMYYVNAVNGDKTNYNLGVKTDSLEGGKLNRITIVIQ